MKIVIMLHDMICLVNSVKRIMYRITVNPDQYTRAKTEIITCTFIL